MKRRDVILVSVAAFLGLCCLFSAIGGLAYFFWPQEESALIIIVATLTPTPPSQVPTLTPPAPTAASPSVSVDIGTPTQLIQPTDLVYQGAFRLPGGDVRPATFAYGGNAMTFNPNGDPSGSGDGFPGSLFITGHDRLAYGELPDGGQVAEVSIPVPVKSDSLGELNQAGFLQEFYNVAEGFFSGLRKSPALECNIWIHRQSVQRYIWPGGNIFSPTRRLLPMPGLIRICRHLTCREPGSSVTSPSTVLTDICSRFQHLGRINTQGADTWQPDVLGMAAGREWARRFLPTAPGLTMPARLRHRERILKRRCYCSTRVH